MIPSMEIPVKIKRNAHSISKVCTSPKKPIRESEAIFVKYFAYVGFEFGLRNNKQEALNNALITNANATFDTADNKIQNYWLFGISYAF